MVDGLLILLLFQFLGELVIHFTGLPLYLTGRGRGLLRG